MIWATQVLESLAKTGLPSRAEDTDAAMSRTRRMRDAEQSPFIREAVASPDYRHLAEPRFVHSSMGRQRS